MPPPFPRLLLGHYGSFWRRKPFWLDREGVETHKHVIGSTGKGKSKFLSSQIVQLIEQGIGVGLIDPTSLLATETLALLHDRGLLTNPQTAGKILYVPFWRTDRFLPFNFLNQPRYDTAKMASYVVEVFERIYQADEASTPLLANMVLYGATILIENNLPLTELSRLFYMGRKPWRDELLRNTRDRRISEFFHENFDLLPAKDQLDHIQSTQRRINLLIHSPTIRYTLGQTANALDFRELMDRGISVIYDLGGLSARDKRFLGALIAIGYEKAADSRADLLRMGIRPKQYHLIMDEFATFSAQSGKSLEHILSEARKFGLFLTMAHQTWSQIPDDLQGALGNTIRIAFGLPPDDAEIMAPHFTTFDPYRIKHTVETGQERSHPVFFGVPDTDATMASQIEQLRTRHAFVKAPWHTGFPWHRPITRTEKIKTLHIPDIKAAAMDIEWLKEEFSRSLMTPAEEVMASVDAIAPVIANPPPKVKIRYTSPLDEQ